MTILVWLRKNYKKSQNVHSILESIELIGYNIACKIDAFKFVETLIVNPIFDKFYS